MSLIFNPDQKVRRFLATHGPGISFFFIIRISKVYWGDKLGYIFFTFKKAYDFIELIYVFLHLIQKN